MPALSPKTQLDGFIDKYDPAIARQARAALKKMRTRLPNAHVLVYDNYNALAIGFGPSERASEAIFSIALYPRWVSLFFLQGAKLKDERKLLKGAGSTVRHIVLKDVALLDSADVVALMDQALTKAKVPLEDGAKGQLIIKSVSPKQRPRRP